MDINLTIRGLQETQAKNLRRIARLEPGGEFGTMIRNTTVYTHSEAVKVTHVDTGTLRASHRMQITNVRGLVFIDPSAVNPRSGAKPVDYGPVEEARGGSHAFYTIARQRAIAYVRQQLPNLAREIVK